MDSVTPHKPRARAPGGGDDTTDEVERVQPGPWDPSEAQEDVTEIPTQLTSVGMVAAASASKRKPTNEDSDAEVPTQLSSLKSIASVVMQKHAVDADADAEVPTQLSSAKSLAAALRGKPTADDSDTEIPTDMTSASSLTPLSGTVLSGTIPGPDSVTPVPPAAPAPPAARVAFPTHTKPTSTEQGYSLAPGTRLGEYRVESKIGEGGMGVVFAAVHPLIGKRAAIKILKKELCADPNTLQRFVDEARVVNQIGHPNIVDIFAFGEMPDGRSYFVMEWLQGETLRERIARGPISIAEIGAIVRPLSRALQAAHDKGVIHRDLKPDNVFLVPGTDDQPTVKLLDFGIAKLVSSDHGIELTATGAIVGTPQYIAPEQAKGYAIDHRVDIYALGSILFELLTGRSPFIADNAMEMVAKHLMEAPERPGKLAPNVPLSIDELVIGMLAKAPEGRPTLAEVRTVFERVLGRASTQGVSGSVRVQSGPIRGASRPPGPALTPAPVAKHVHVRPGRTALVPPPAPALLTSPREPRSHRRKAMWIAIVGVPIAGILAFLLVRQLSSPKPATSSRGAAPTHAPLPLPVPDRTPVAAAVHAPVPVSEPVRVPPPVQITTPPPASNAPAGPEDAATEPVVSDPALAPVTKLATGKLRLNVIGAMPLTQILIDGRPGRAIMQLPVGTHSVEIRTRGMPSQKLQVEIRANALTTRRIALTPISPRPRKEPARKKAAPIDAGGTKLAPDLTPRK